MIPKTLITLLLEQNLCKIRIKDQEGTEVEGNNCSHRAQLSSHNPFQSQPCDEKNKPVDRTLVGLVQKTT